MHLYWTSNIRTAQCALTYSHTNQLITPLAITFFSLPEYDCVVLLYTMITSPENYDVLNYQSIKRKLLMIKKIRPHIIQTNTISPTTHRIFIL
jgi:hypothetical protein